VTNVGCPNDPGTHQSVIIVVKNGGVSVGAGTVVNGSVILDGNYNYSGDAVVAVTGSIIADQLVLKGGADFALTACWVNNQPGPFDVTPTHWSEIDR
jgi:hypothetical protein